MANLRNVFLPGRPLLSPRGVVSSGQLRTCEQSVTCFSSAHSQHQSPLVLLQAQVLQQRDLHQRSLFRELVWSHRLPAAAARTTFPAAAASQPQPGRPHPLAVLPRPLHLQLQRRSLWQTHPLRAAIPLAVAASALSDLCCFLSSMVHSWGSWYHWFTESCPKAE